MIVIKYFVLIAVCLILFSCSKEEPPLPGDNDIVYVCTSNSAKTYHTYRDCGSLKQCSADVLEVSRKKARENERIICMNCKNRGESKQKDSVK
ncbi:MAG TPA: hypothetical protein VG961_14685 [Ignavibacteria bacterium]|nr:hypothetical protein [Ignavibacteria bacterium]